MGRYLKDCEPLKTVIILPGLFGCLFYLGLSGGVFQVPLVSFFTYVIAHLLLYLFVFQTSFSKQAHKAPFPDKGSNEFDVDSRASASPRIASSKKQNAAVRLPCLAQRLLEASLSTRGIIAMAVILRISFATYPLSDDVNRYAWEGFIQNRGINPYLHPPKEFVSEFASDPIFKQINHKDFPAIYPPLSLLAFRTISKIFYIPNQPSTTMFFGFKFFFICSDILVIILLVRILKEWNKPRHWLALYAWNPLVLLYGAGEGHIDIFQNVFIASTLLQRKIGKDTFRKGFFLLGCAIMTKYVAIVMLPFVITRKNLRNLPFLFLPFLLFLPFWDRDIFSSLGAFARELHYNDLIPRLLRLAVEGPLYHAALLLFFFGGVFWIWLIRKETPERSMGLSWMWMLLCLPTFHPWYLIPMILFLVHSPNRAWLTLATTMGVNFWVYHHQWNTGVWMELSWIWYGVYLPFFCVMLRDLWRINLPWFQRYLVPTSFDIVVPTLNEENNLRTFLDNLQNSIHHLNSSSNLAHFRPFSEFHDTDHDLVPKCQVIIVDGGSTDSTLSIASEYNLKVIELNEASRGNQMAIGIQAGTGEVVLMLHADAFIHRTALQRLHGKFIKYPTLQWGIMGHCYDSKSSKMRVIEISNRIRFFFAGIAFGDQGIFVRRKVLKGAGGMPKYPLMEDVELSLRLARFQCRLNLQKSLLVSTRRWKTKKFTGYTFQVLRLVITFLGCRRLGCNTENLAHKFYRVYYR